MEQMRDISQPSRVPEREAGVARCESQLVFPLLETGSESIAQQQPQGQQQFETGERGCLEDLAVKRQIWDVPGQLFTPEYNLIPRAKPVEFLWKPLSYVD